MRFVKTREVIQVFVPKYAKGKTLDIGGGNSKYREIIKPHVDEYLVSDIFQAPGVDFVEDARKLSHPDDSFGTVLSFQALEHIDDTHAVVREMYRVLKRGGHAIVTAPFIGARHGHPSDFHRFTLEGLCWYFESAGFEIKESGKQGGSLSVCAELLRFSFLNPYKKHGKIRRKIIRATVSFLVALDRRNYFANQDIYNNAYVVAVK